MDDEEDEDFDGEEGGEEEEENGVPGKNLPAHHTRLRLVDEMIAKLTCIKTRHLPRRR